MCGIAGILASESSSESEILAMTQSLSHRGPDALHVHQIDSGTLSLGHTRLSILDLSHAADQPMFSHDQRYAIVFNGEIYNFHAIRNELVKLNPSIHFKTNSDTEVVLLAFLQWGSDMVTKLEGMFAIVIADLLQHKFFIFRDRVGKKPLYYFLSKTHFVFASEIKSILKHSHVSNQREINKEAVGTFLHLGYIPEPHTIYKKIFKFPAGCTARIGEELELIIKKYWGIQEIVSNDSSPQSIEGAKKRLSKILTESVEKRLVSDVPLGSFLSGGTDSSLISAIAKKSLGKLKTFSIGFKDQKFDESIFARKVAKCLQTEHTEYIVLENEAAQILDSYLRHFDEPFADTSAIPTMLVSKLARQEVKVALTGDGGDELFQGYGSYTWANRLSHPFWQKINGFAEVILRASGKSQWVRVADLISPPQIGGLRSHIFSQEQYFFSQQEIKEKLLVDQNYFEEFRYDESFIGTTQLSEGEKQAIFDIQFYLKDDLLVKVDRSSMYYALECRCPFLDHNLIDYAFQLDKSFKKNHGKSKWILKELLIDYLPKELVDRPKWGFSVPLAKWLKSDLRYLFEDFLKDEVIEEVGLFNLHYINHLKKEFLSGKDYLYNRLWLIIVLHKWWKENQ